MTDKLPYTLRATYDDNTKEEFITILNKYLPPITEHPINDRWASLLSGQPDNDESAFFYLLCVFVVPTGFYSVWNPKDDGVKIEKMLRTARELVRLWDSLPEDIHMKIEDASEDIVRSETERVLKETPWLVQLIDPIPDISNIIFTLGRLNMLERSIKLAKDEIKQAHSLGRKNWQAISIVHFCREIWRRRKGNEAPKSLNPASPFGEFVQEIFDVMGTEADPRSAMAAWKRVQSKEENT